MNLKRIKTTICAGVLAVSMILPGMAAYAASPEADADHQFESAEKIIKKVIKSTNEYVTYQNESFTFLFEQEPEGEENGDATNVTKVTIGNEGKVTISGVSQNLSASVDDGTNVKTEMATTDSYWTRTVYGDIDLGGFTTEGIYTYKVTEEAHGTGNNSLAQWTDSKAEYCLRVYVENVGGTELVKTVTLEQRKDQDGKALSETKKVTELEFDNSVTAPTFALTKFVEGDEDARAQSKGYPFMVQSKTSPLKYLIQNGNDPVNLSDVHEVASGTYFYLKKNQTAIFINIPAGNNAVSKVQEAKNKSGVDYTAPDLGVTWIKYDLYYNGVRDAKKSSVGTNDDGEVKFSAENSLSNIDVKQTGTKLDWTNICKDDVILTGVVTDIAPYVTLVVVAGAAIALYVVIRKKMR